MAERLTPEEALREKPHIAIAGASGRIGQRLQALWAESFRITPLQHQKEVVPNQDGQEVIEDFDITNLSGAFRTADKLSKNGVTTVVNATGVLSVDASEETRGNPQSQMFIVHAVGTEFLARACRESGLNYVHLSTEYVFDGKKPIGQKYTEDDLPDKSAANPTWYGQTKALGESIVKDIYPEKSVIVRISQVQSIAGGLFLATLRAIQRGEPFTRTDNQQISAISDITAAEALARIIAKMESDGQVAPIYHVSATDSFTPYVVARFVTNAYELDRRAKELITPVTLEQLVESGEQKVVRPKNSTLDVTRFRQEFGLHTLRTNWKEAVRFAKAYPNI